MREYWSKDSRIFIVCSVLLVGIFILNVVLHWTVGGILYLLVIMLSLRSSKNRDTYLFAAMASLLLIAGWRLFPSTEKIWHVAIVLVWTTAVSGVRFKKGQIMKSALGAIIDSSLDAIIGRTLTNRIASWNGAAENLFGYTRAEIMGQSADCLVPERGIADERHLLAEVKKGVEIKQHQNGSPA